MRQGTHGTKDKLKIDTIFSVETVDQSISDQVVGDKDDRLTPQNNTSLVPNSPCIDPEIKSTSYQNSSKKDPALKSPSLHSSPR